MNQEPKKHLSPWIAWSIVILVAGATGFAVWYYWNQIDTIASNINIASVKKSSTDKTKTATTTPTTPAATADWKTFEGANYTIKYEPSWITYNNELAGKEYWYENQTLKDAGSQYLVGISVDKTTNTLAQITSSNIAGIEKEDSNNAASSTTVTLGGLTMSKIVTQYKGKDTEKNTSYLAVKDGYLIAVYPYQIIQSDLNSMISTLTLMK